jgi:hypothetical protein
LSPEQVLCLRRPIRPTYNPLRHNFAVLVPAHQLCNFPPPSPRNPPLPPYHTVCRSGCPPSPYWCPHIAPVWYRCTLWWSPCPTVPTAPWCPAPSSQPSRQSCLESEVRLCPATAACIQCPLGHRTVSNPGLLAIHHLHHPIPFPRLVERPLHTTALWYRWSPYFQWSPYFR